ncbi:response regulator [Paenibacillus sp. NPDC056579]|uniref:response regulator n=1 Tax=Paenibacillus sp. NPDC056579 TaxID=3345871 RepID=UPI003678D8DE
MIRLLIADDEPVIADGLYDEFIELGDPELDVIRVYSGKEAVRCLEKTKFDIVISDIRMPGVDGLELARLIHNDWPECKIIFLTGYRDFEYAYEAIQQGAVNYVLKTEGYDKVVEAVRLAIAGIEAKRQDMQIVTQAKKQLKTMSSILRRNFLIHLLGGAKYELPALEDEFVQLEMNMRAHDDCLLFMARVDTLPYGLSYLDQNQYYYSIEHIAEQYLSPRLHLLPSEDSHGNMLWVAQPRHDYEGEASEEKAAVFLKGTLESIQRACRESLNTTVSFVMLTFRIRWNQLPEGYNQLRYLMDFRIGSGIEMLLTDESVPASEIAKTAVPAKYFPFGKHMSLESLLEKGERDSFMKEMDDIASQLHPDASILDPIVQEIFFSVSTLLFSHMNRWNLLPRLSLQTGYYRLFRVDEFSTFAEAWTFVKQLAGHIIDVQDIERNKRASDTVSFVCQYIQDHIEDELTLVKLSERVHFNPAYLSRLFKQETGSTLTDYIQEKKIARAKQLLENTDINVHEIGEMLGYGYGSNFARTFKKLTGMSPKEHRESFNKY